MDRLPNQDDVMPKLRLYCFVVGVMLTVESFCRMVFSSSIETLYETNSQMVETTVEKGANKSLVVFHAAFFITDIMLLIGLIKERACCILPWLIAHTLRKAVKGLGFIIHAFLPTKIFDHLSIVVAFELVWANSISIFVVYCYYIELRHVRDRSTYDSVASEAHEL